MKEEINLLFWLRRETFGNKQRRKSSAERDHAWMGAVEKDVLLQTNRQPLLICTRCHNQKTQRRCTQSPRAKYQHEGDTPY